MEVKFFLTYTEFIRLNPNKIKNCVVITQLIENFTISSFIPKIDLCCLFEQYKNCSENVELKISSEANLELKEQAREEKRFIKS